MDFENEHEREPGRAGRFLLYTLPAAFPGLTARSAAFAQAVLLLLAGLCLAWGLGIPAFLPLIAVGQLFQYTVRRTAGGLEIRWLWLRARVPLASIAGVRRQRGGWDPVRFFHPALRVERRGHGPLRILGSSRDLGELARALAPREREPNERQGRSQRPIANM